LGNSIKPNPPQKSKITPPPPVGRPESSLGPWIGPTRTLGRGGGGGVDCRVGNAGEPPRIAVRSRIAERKTPRRASQLRLRLGIDPRQLRRLSTVPPAARCSRPSSRISSIISSVKRVAAPGVDKLWRVR